MCTHAYPFQSVQIIVEVAESFPSVVAPVCSTHEVFQHQTNVNQGDLIIWRKVSLQHQNSKGYKIIQASQNQTI